MVIADYWFIDLFLFSSMRDYWDGRRLLRSRRIHFTDNPLSPHLQNHNRSGKEAEPIMVIATAEVLILAARLPDEFKDKLSLEKVSQRSCI